MAARHTLYVLLDDRRAPVEYGKTAEEVWERHVHNDLGQYFRYRTQGYTCEEIHIMLAEP